MVNNIHQYQQSGQSPLTITHRLKRSPHKIVVVAGVGGGEGLVW
jgi:hypothetical protein